MECLNPGSLEVLTGCKVEPLGHSRLYLGTGWVKKSSASTHSSREKVTVWGLGG